MSNNCNNINKTEVIDMGHFCRCLVKRILLSVENLGAILLQWLKKNGSSMENPDLIVYFHTVTLVLSITASKELLVDNLCQKAKAFKVPNQCPRFEKIQRMIFATELITFPMEYKLEIMCRLVVE